MTVFLLMLPASPQSSAAPPPGGGWPSVTAQAAGLNSKVLDEFDADIRRGKYGHIDSLLVIRHGKLAYERNYPRDYARLNGKASRKPGALVVRDPSGPYNYLNPWWHPFYRRGDLHSVQSITKTVVSVVIGAAVARRDFPPLDTPILRFFESTKIANLDERKRRITIGHLMTMRSGLDWNENLPYSDSGNTAAAMEASNDWIRFTLDRPMAHEPGAVFNYNSGAAQLLSHIFGAATGRDLEEYAAEQVFAPLGIESFYWKRSSTGLIDTEGGLFLTSRDLAKIPLLFLRNGIWSGRAIVSPDWVRATVTSDTVAWPNGLKYGLMWLILPYGEGSREAWGGGGFGGQMAIAVPEHDLVFVVTGWNVVPGQPTLTMRTTLERILSAVADPVRRAVD